MTTKSRIPLPPVPTTRMTKNQIIQTYQNVMAVFERTALAGSLGQTFGGDRDMYQILGWKKRLEFQDYLDLYDRNGMAARVVDALADESWRLAPEMTDGDIQSGDEDEDKLTEFLTSWNEMAERLDLWSIFNDLDTALGISRYAVILLGAPGKLDSPLARAVTINYLQVYDEGQAKISTTDRDINSRRYGMPTMYNITFEDGGQSRPVHFTRVIHCKEGRGRSRVYGIPRLKKSYNYLSDLEKVVGSSSEAFWLLIRKGLIISAKEGMQLPTKGSPDYEDMQAEISEWEHQLRRVMRVKGMDVTDLGAQVVDGKAQHDLLITDIAGTNGMPQRVLVGSERGELASTQDDSNWAGVVAARQHQECEKWVKDYARTLIALGTLPKPNGKMGVKWQELFKLTAMDRAIIADKVAATIVHITNGAPETAVDIAEFMKEHFNYILPKNATTPKATAPVVIKKIPNSTPPGSNGGGLKGKQTSQLIEDAIG